MPHKVRTAFIAVLASIVVFACVDHFILRDRQVITIEELRQPPVPLYPLRCANYAIRKEEEKHERQATQQSSRHATSVTDSISTVSILLPAWEVLVILLPETPPVSVTDGYTCLFPNNDSSPAKLSGALPSPRRTTFRCNFPQRLRRRLPFPQPILTTSPDRQCPAQQELLRWNFLVYYSFSTENDVVLFAKGINNRQGVNRAPNEFKCVFGDDVINGVKTAVTSSLQEVFRCQLPELTAVSGRQIKMSLEISQQNRVVPSVAYYTPLHKIEIREPKALICACTVVYNAAKFVKEWVVYHSSIGVERFILYDNDSNDDLELIVEELVQEGHNVSKLLWLWPKTQEAAFSHCAIYSNNFCAWMMYIDVDEFIYSPSWVNSSSNPSTQLLKSLLPNSLPSTLMSDRIGQVMISCYEFGPSNQKSHPAMGVTQGYNCRRLVENRHKSIVLLEAIDESLVNVVHHFELKRGYRWKKLGLQEAVVNHYKFQAWSEFKAKFRRRVSAYVVDWMQAANLASKDRTPGLGFSAVEPGGWPEKFCEVYDNQLKDLTRRWFGFELPSGHRMAWQR